METEDEILNELVSKLSDAPTDRLPPISNRFRISNSYVSDASLQTKHWLEKRQNFYNPINSALSDLLRALFSSLELDSNKKADGLSVMEQLITLGLASDPGILIKVTFKEILTSAFKESISKLRLSLNDMMTFCAGDKKTDFILNKLNSSQIKRSRSPPVVKQLLIKEEPSIFSHGESMSVTEKPSKQGLSMAEHLGIINWWWNSIDPNKEGFADPNTAALKLVDVGIVTNVVDGKKLLGPNENKAGMITEEEFQEVFAKSMLKGALLSLAERLSEGPLAKPFLTTTMKLSMYKRKLLIARIKPDDVEISKREGETALKAIEKYKNFVRTISSKK